MPHRIPYSRRNRPFCAVHLRLARLADLADVAVFCERHRDSARARGRPTGELSALLHGHVDTVILALRERTLLGVALCGINRGRARLIELVVEPGRDLPCIERRLLRRTLRNLRGLGVRSLDFSAMGRDGVDPAIVRSTG